jgi:UrcA family protein
MTRFVTKMLLLGSLAGFAAGTAAAATVAGEAPALVVRYNAETLQTDSGARVLYHRLARAAERVCPNTSYSLFTNPVVLKCRQEALAGAVNKIHNQRLAAVHAAASAKSG